MIEVRELYEPAELEELYRLIGAIWRPEPGSEPIQVELLRALSHAGNYVAGAFTGGEMVGLSVAFLADPPGVALHSHITGALPGRGAGRALKLHQREWALARGLSRITWTYDPLVRRNAYVNLVRLGARAEEYLPSFYGPVNDSINAGDDTDRMLAVWPLADPRVAAAVRGERVEPDVPDGAVVALDDRGGRPSRPAAQDAQDVQDAQDAQDAAGAPAVRLVAVPEDIEALRRSDPAAAGEWRLAVRDVLGGLLDGGARVTGFHRRAYYVVEGTA